MALVLFIILVATASVSPLSSPPDAQKDFSSSKQDIAKEIGSANVASSIPYCKVVKSYANEYGLDYRFVLALIKQESQFDAEAVSERGAFGLMQIMPVTGDEISERINVKNIEHPRGNIHAGIYYFTRMYKLFSGADEENRLRLSLAAYYAGPARIYDAQEVAAYMGEDPNRWSSIKNSLPLLSKRYYSLHRAVWNDGKPHSGYFKGWNLTLAYVVSVMDNYEEYRKVLN